MLVVCEMLIPVSSCLRTADRSSVAVAAMWIPPIPLTARILPRFRSDAPASIASFPVLSVLFHDHRAASPVHKTLIIGCGNSTRRDEGLVSHFIVVLAGIFPD